MSLVTRTSLFSILILFAPLAIAGPTVEGLVTLLIYLVVMGLLFWCVWWFLSAIGLPEPFNKVAHVIVALVAFIIVIYILLSLLPPLSGIR